MTRGDEYMINNLVITIFHRQNSIASTTKDNKVTLNVRYELQLKIKHPDGVEMKLEMVLVVEMTEMTIPMIPDVMTMMMTTISPSRRLLPWQESAYRRIFHYV